MARQAHPPSSCYAADEAIQRLHMSRATFFKHVQNGRIPKTIDPVSGQGYYQKSMVEQRRQENALFILKNSMSPLFFDRATSKQEIYDIDNICIHLYKDYERPLYDGKIDLWEKYPDIYYVVKQDGVVSAYATCINLSDEGLHSLFHPLPHSRRGLSSMPPSTQQFEYSYILPRQDTIPVRHVLLSLGIRSGVPTTLQRKYAFKLIRGILDLFSTYVEQKNPIEILHTLTTRTDGIRSAEKVGMEKIITPGDAKVRFSLDLQKKPDTRLQRLFYRQIYT